jgi:hypothetical protein
LPKTETFFSSSKNAIKKESVNAINNKIVITLKPYDITMIKSKGKEGKFENFVLGNSKTEPLIIYPNPAHETINIKNNLSKINKVEIFTINGKLIYQSKLISEKIELPNSLIPGKYQLLLHTYNETITNKLIIN